MIYRGPEISTYWGGEEYSNRKAVVMKDDNGFYVEFYKEEQLWERRNVYGHSQIYAENAAENFVMGIIQ